MAYPIIDAKRFLYNLDGTEVKYNKTNDFLNGIVGSLTQAQMDQLQSETGIYNGDGSSTGELSNNCLWWFFPEPREITHMKINCFSLNYQIGPGDYVRLYSLQGSNDTTDGVNGTWDTYTFTENLVMVESETEAANSQWAWRSPAELTPPVFEAKYKVFRAKIKTNAGYLKNIHLYGHFTTGAGVDDLAFLKADATTQYTALHDFGDTMEGETYDVNMYLKNVSPTKIANTVTINVRGSHASYITISLDGVAYSSAVTIPSLAPGATQLLKVRNIVGPAPQILKPRNVYLHAKPISWT